MRSHLGHHHRAVVAAAVAVGVARGHEAGRVGARPGRRGRGRPRRRAMPTGRWVGTGVVMSWWCSTTNDRAGGLGRRRPPPPRLRWAIRPGPAVGAGRVDRHHAQPGHVEDLHRVGGQSQPLARPWPGESRGVGRRRRGRCRASGWTSERAGSQVSWLPGMASTAEPALGHQSAEAVPVGLAARVGQVALGHQQLGPPLPRSRPPRPGGAHRVGLGRRPALGHAAQEAEAAPRPGAGRRWWRSGTARVPVAGPGCGPGGASGPGRGASSARSSSPVRLQARQLHRAGTGVELQRATSTPARRPWLAGRPRPAGRARGPAR